MIVKKCEIRMTY